MSTDPRLSSAYDEEDDDVELTLAPTDPEADAARAAIRDREPAPPLVDDGTSDSDEPPVVVQFTIRQILWANVGLAIALTLVRIVAPEMVAFLLGVVAFATFLLVHSWQPTDQRAYTVSWVLIAVYILFAMIALAV